MMQRRNEMTGLPDNNGNDFIRGLATNPCINGITKADALEIKKIPELESETNEIVNNTIPSLDERVTALEQGGSSSNGYTFVPKQYISQVKNQIVDYNEEFGVYFAKTNMYVVIIIIPDTYYFPILKNEPITGNRTIMRTSGNTSTLRNVEEYSFILEDVFNDESSTLLYSLNRIVLSTDGTISIQYQESRFTADYFALSCENIDFNPNN